MNTITVNSTQYIFPPRAEKCIPQSYATPFLEMGWLPQLKYNDSRTLIKYTPDTNNTYNIELWNRHGEKFRTYTAPQFLLNQLQQLPKTLNLNPTQWHLLDGGLLDQKHKAIKDTIVIWDILVQNSQHLLGTTYQERYNHLHTLNKGHTHYHTHPSHKPIDLGISIDQNIILARQYTPQDWNTLWQTVHTINAPHTNGTDIKPILEGVILKDPHGTLEMGFKEKNNTSWMVKSRITTGRHRF